jgi:hypothetical protein
MIFLSRASHTLIAKNLGMFNLTKFQEKNIKPKTIHFEAKTSCRLYIFVQDENERRHIGHKETYNVHNSQSKNPSQYLYFYGVDFHNN